MTGLHVPWLRCLQEGPLEPTAVGAESGRDFREKCNLG